MRTQTLLALCAALTVAACCSVASGDRSQIPRGDRKDRQMQAMHDNQSIVGPEGLMLFGGSGEEQPDTGGGIGVNSFLWRASRSEEHTSELQSLMRISYAVFCLKKKKKQ